MDRLHHERSYRGTEALDRLRTARVAVCGAGALGGNLAESLARQGIGRLLLIDRDRVEEGNLCTQPYQRSDIGRPKARILANALFRAVGTEAEAAEAELSAENAGWLLRGSALALDTFDNTAARGAVQLACRALGLPCLHAGMNGGYGEVVWDEVYRVPADAGADPCAAPLARNLVLLVTAVAAEAAVRFLVTGRKQSHTITLEDLAIRSLGM
jgi:molybdopterin-synthase adenylyltransferase